ncbi:MAG: glutamate dehydrogenase [Myxococcota bacterium]|nr:glutamate dehydrogenase [Myxococcota bacterium]
MNAGPRNQKNSLRGVVTGKTEISGGSRGRNKATGQGLVYALQEWAQDNDLNLDGATFSLQGFGKVGAAAASILTRLGASLVAVMDHTGAISNPEGVHPKRLANHIRATGGLKGYSGGTPIETEEFFSTKVDIFIPAALELQITAETAPIMDCRVVVEGANGPCSLEGEKILTENGTAIIPDILANAGGVTVSYFEWLQNRRAESWSLETVDNRLYEMMTEAYRTMRRTATEYGVDFRTAAYIHGLNRIQAVYRERGIFP